MGFQVGQFAEITRRYSRQDVSDFTLLGGHSVSDRQVPEPLIDALFSYLLGVKLPGRGTNYLKQESRFVGRARVGEELTARVEITRLRPEKHLADLTTTCVAGDGTRICEGRALVFVEDVAT